MADVIMPKMGDAMESGTLIAWKVKDGDAVKAGDVIAEIETDKSNVEIEAEDAGTFHVSVAEGTSVPVGGIIATIGNGSSKPAPAADAKPAAETKPAPAAEKPAEPKPTSTESNPPKVETSSWKPPRIAAPATGPTAERLKASPLARKVARERGIDIAQVTGTGPNGRIIEADVVGFTPKAAPKIAAAPSAQSAPVGQGEFIEHSQIRKVIAKRMVESKTTIPHFYVTIEVDVTEIVALREKLNSYDTSLTKVSLNDMIVKASAKALAKFPDANSVYREGKTFRPSGQHVGIAVALDDGLIVPVVRDAGTISLRQLAKTSKDLITKAREKKLQPSEYSGGTFTVSNLGGFDVDNFIAIIDPSQGAILAVSTIVKKPVVLDDDSIVARPLMNLTLSADHRIMDGATGAKFMQELKRIVLNPLSILE